MPFLHSKNRVDSSLFLRWCLCWCWAQCIGCCWCSSCENTAEAALLLALSAVETSSRITKSSSNLVAHFRSLSGPNPRQRDFQLCGHFHHPIKALPKYFGPKLILWLTSSRRFEPRCHLPSLRHPYVRYRGRPCIDGGVSWNNPILDRQTLRVSPLWMDTRADISPSMRINPWWGIHVPSTELIWHMFELGRCDMRFWIEHPQPERMSGSHKRWLGKLRGRVLAQ